MKEKKNVASVFWQIKGQNLSKNQIIGPLKYSEVIIVKKTL